MLALNEVAGKDTSIDRTRRLFYVTCSRAEESLAVIYYSDDPTAARTAVLEQGWFAEEEIEILTACPSSNGLRQMAV